MNEAARREAISKALEAAEAKPDAERIRIPWKGGTETFPVVVVPLDAVVLNPQSHRIKAQLESDERRGSVASDPHGEEAQQALTDLLTATEGFEDLKENLKEKGQLDVGVVTRAGVLVNANTRAVALRAIDPHGFISVAVLPPDASARDLARLELQLQIKRDFKQDYTFSNQLLIIEEMKREYKFSDEETAKELDWAASSDPKSVKEGTQRVQQATRMLAMIQELRSRSENRIPLTFFDDKRQAMIDLDQAYEQGKKSDVAGAELLKEARFAGILGGTFYRELRKLDAATAVDYVVSSLSEQEYIEPVFEAITQASEPAVTTDPEGLDLLGGDDPATEDQKAIATIRSFVNVLAESHGRDEVEVDRPNGKVTLDRETFVSAVAEAIEESVELAGADERNEKSLEGPLRLVRESRIKTQRAHEGFLKAHNRPGFDTGKFRYELKQLETAVEALRKTFDQFKAS
jgi:hypothetical protein